SANSISVCVAESDTMRSGRCSRVTAPVGVSTVTGNPASLADAAPGPSRSPVSSVPPPPHAARSISSPAAAAVARVMVVRTSACTSCRLGRGHICRQGCHPVAQRALFPEGFVRPTGQATWLVPPRWRASQLRDSAGVGPDFAGRWARGHGTSRVGGGPPRPLAGAASIRPARLPDMSDADVDDDRPAVQGTVEAGFEGVRAAFEQNFVRHGEVGAAFALYVDGRKVVDLWGGVA